MIGTTGLKSLQVDCIVGIYAHERHARQTVMLDIELDYDFAAAAGSDGIADALDYDQVAHAINHLLQERGFQLLEAMAEHTATMLLARFGQVRRVHLEIRKPAAVPAAMCAFVRVERTRA